VVDTVCPSGQACGRREGCAGSPRTLRHTRGHASRTTARVLAALAGVPLRLVVARGLLALQLREFRVDGAQTPLTGHLLPPPHHVGAPEATGRVLQIGEPSMDGVRHDRPPSPPAWWITASLSRERVVNASNGTRVGRSAQGTAAPRALEPPLADHVRGAMMRRSRLAGCVGPQRPDRPRMGARFPHASCSRPVQCVDAPAPCLRPLRQKDKNNGRFLHDPSGKTLCLGVSFCPLLER